MYFHEPLPFHMVYPVTGCIEQEKVIEKEHARMFSYFSADIQAIQKRIEENMDQMEYDGSPMFDEYPDKEWMRRIGQSIRDGWMQEDRIRPEEGASMFSENTAAPESGVFMEGAQNPSLPATEAQIYMLVVWEVFRRRAKKRRANLIS